MAEQIKQERGSRLADRVFTAQTLYYGIALLGYIGLGEITQHYLTFTWGLIYFIGVLEVIPRAYRRVRAHGQARQLNSNDAA